MRAYLEACPSDFVLAAESGIAAGEWLAEHPVHGAAPRTALDMASPGVGAHRGIRRSLVARAGCRSACGNRCGVMDHVATVSRLVRAHYAVDDALIAVRHESGSSNGSSNNQLRLDTTAKRPREI